MLLGFEELFSEKQSDFIALCMEYLDNNRIEADMIYVYIYQTKYERMFNAFFSVNKTILSAGEIASEEDSDAFFDVGIGDIETIINLCDQYEHPCPNEFKLVYNVRTKRFFADYNYEDYSGTDISPDDVFMEWIKEKRE